jgi:hypothetical protein
MTDQAMIVGRRKCEEKTARGNCYLDEETAEQEAAHMSLTIRKRIKAYRCQFGAHWHLGSDRSIAERQERSAALQKEGGVS